MKPILLFDIDGTLLHIKKSFTQEVVHAVLKHMEFSGNPLSGMSFAGRTDKDIFNEIAGVFTDDANKREEIFYEIKEAYLNILLRELTSEEINVIDGALETVHLAAEYGIDIGLCTGNFREAAHKKVESAGFHSLFLFGGFGCDHADRKHLPEAAHLEYVELKGAVPEREAYIVIGDTPNDIRSANYFGARSVAVTTGGFSSEDFSAHKPDLTINNLRELNPVYFSPQ